MNLNSLFLTPLGASAPIGVNKKCDVLGAVASIIGSMIDSGNVSATNEANRWQALVTNMTNERINDSQLQWARDQYLQEKAENRFLVDQAYEREIENREHNEWYNSPAQQVARLRAAGINPALAMYGGSGMSGTSHSSINAQTGQIPHANQPNAIPMDSGAPAVPYTGFGRGISDAIAAYYEGKNQERNDYALAADITFRDNAQRQKTIDQLLEMKKEGTNERWINSQINALMRSISLDENKFEHQKEVDRVNQVLDSIRVQSEQMSVKIQHMLARSNIQLNQAKVMEISSNIAVAQAEVQEMIANGVSQRRINDYIANREKETFEIVQRQNEREKRNNVPGIRQIYVDFTDWLFTPLKGLVSVAVK